MDRNSTGAKIGTTVADTSVAEVTPLPRRYTTSQQMRDVRDEAMAPADGRLLSPSEADSLRKIVERLRERLGSNRQVALAARVDEAVLSRFVRGGTVRQSTADKLIDLANREMPGVAAQPHGLSYPQLRAAVLVWQDEEGWPQELVDACLSGLLPADGANPHVWRERLNLLAAALRRARAVHHVAAPPRSGHRSGSDSR